MAFLSQTCCLTTFVAYVVMLSAFLWWVARSSRLDWYAPLSALPIRRAG